MPSIVCVVLDPSRIVREGLTHILAKSPLEPACIASNIGDVPSTIADAGEPVLVLTGVRDRSGLANDVGAVKARFPNAHVVVVGDATQGECVTAALDLGATSFVDENVATSSLIKELELVAMGEPVISTLILKWVLGNFAFLASTEIASAAETVSPAVDEPPSPELQRPVEQKQLSSREVAILSGLVEGASNKMIACQLKITEATVKVHVKAILRKIRVRNRTQAAIWALKRPGAPKRLVELQPKGLALPRPDLGEPACEAPGWVPARALRAEDDGSSLGQASLVNA